MLSFINPDALYDPRPNGYSHVAVVGGGGALAYVAGQGGERRDGSLPDTLEEQIHQAFENLRVALEAVGGRLDQVVKLTTYVVDYDESAHASLAHAAREVFGQALPAQTLVPVGRLALPGMRFEVDAVAHLRT
ncbi:MAG: Rid family hydrolase [Myxococcota bacterium]